MADLLGIDMLNLITLKYLRYCKHCGPLIDVSFCFGNWTFYLKGYANSLISVVQTLVLPKPNKNTPWCKKYFYIRLEVSTIRSPHHTYTHGLCNSYKEFLGVVCHRVGVIEFESEGKFENFSTFIERIVIETMTPSSPPSQEYAPTRSDDILRRSFSSNFYSNASTTLSFVGKKSSNSIEWNWRRRLWKSRKYNGNGNCSKRTRKRQNVRDISASKYSNKLQETTGLQTGAAIDIITRFFRWNLRWLE